VPWRFDVCHYAAMRIGLNGAGSSVDRIVEQAVEAEAAGFTSLWYPSAIAGDPMVAIAFAGRATASIELGTAVLQTYTCHPVLMARRAASVAAAMGRPGFTLGLGPSHEPVIEGYGLSYAHPGRHTEEYVQIVAAALRGEDPSYDGEDFRVQVSAGSPADPPVPVLLGALAPRMLRVAAQVADGTILWMANASAITAHVVPRLGAAAEAVGRPMPRIVAGLPVAVHDDVDEARAAAAQQFAVYASLPNYTRILELGGVASPADAAIVGSEDAVTEQLEELVAAGTTDVWAAIFSVGDDRAGSRERTRALLAKLASTG
jgi:F420-dependent oxidoreductase-like protein